MILEKLFSQRYVSRFRPDVLDYMLFLPSIWLPCALGVSLRLIGPLFVVIPIGFCLLYAILRRTMPPRLLSLYLVYCTVTGVLSAYKLFPTSWQVHFMEEAILRQMVPLFGFFAVAWASKAYFQRRLQSDGDVFFGAPIFLTLCWIVAPVFMFQQGVGYQGDHSVYAVIALLGSFINNVVVGLFFVFRGIFLERDWRRNVGLAVAVGVAITTHFIQFKLLIVFVIAALFGAPARRLTIGFIVTMVGIYIVAMNFAAAIMIKAPNEGLRLAMLNDVILSTIDTHGIGIGYGKELVRWRYQVPDQPDFVFLPDAQIMTHSRLLEALSTGVENSFAEALLRTGILGFLLFSLAFFAAFPPNNLSRDVRTHAACLFALIFLSCFVNSSLESPISVVGPGFVFGYLIALRDKARLASYVSHKGWMQASRA